MHVFVVPHLPSCLSSDQAPQWVWERLVCVYVSVCRPQSNIQTGAHRADCLAAKEVLRPTVLPTLPHPPSGAPQMPRYSRRSCVHKPLPVDGMGGRRSDKHGPTLVSKLSRRSAPFAALSLSQFNFYPSLSRSLLSTH